MEIQDDIIVPVGPTLLRMLLGGNSLVYRGRFSHANVLSPRLYLWPQHQTEWAITDKAKHPISFFFFFLYVCIIKFFSLPLHIIWAPPSPIPIRETLLVRKTNYPVGCSFSRAFCTIINLRTREREGLEKREIIHQGPSVPMLLEVCVCVGGGMDGATSSSVR